MTLSRMKKSFNVTSGDVGTKETGLRTSPHGDARTIRLTEASAPFRARQKDIPKIKHEQTIEVKIKLIVLMISDCRNVEGTNYRLSSHLSKNGFKQFSRSLCSRSYNSVIESWLSWLASNLPNIHCTSVAHDDEKCAAIIKSCENDYSSYCGSLSSTFILYLCS